VVVGQGKRLFPDTGLDIALDLIDSRSDSKGVTIQVYRPSGRPQYPPANVASNGSRAVDHDALLPAPSPNGIPPRQDVIAAVNDWLAQADSLARQR
jgi:hypothetical protein